MSGVHARVGGLVVIVVALAGLLLGGAGAASAHPTLLFTDPAAETAVPDAPQSITLMFNETVTIGPRAVILLDHTGADIPVAAVDTGHDGHVVTARPAVTLRPGTYTVRWQATGRDGDLVEEDFRFAVGVALAGDAAGNGGAQSISWTDAGLRWLLFAGLAMALGGLIGQRFTASARTENPALPPVRSWVAGGMLVGLVAAVGLGVRVVSGAGSVSVLWRAGPGAVVAVETAGFLAALALCATGRRRWSLLVLAPLVAVVAAEGVRSHADTAAPGWGAMLTGVHLCAAAIWVGALLHTTRAVMSWRHHPAAVRWVLTGYLRLAAWTFAVVITTGVVSALLLLPLSEAASTTYGRVLLVKLALVGTAAGLALTGRATARRGGRIPKLPRVMSAEGAVLVIVLAASATLVSTPPPVGGTPQPPPPSPTGPVVPLGTLAGQIGVAVAASDGQLVVRLTAPRGDYYATQHDRRYALSGRLGAEDATLAWRGCGQGCFVAPVTWAGGDNVLTLRAEAQDAPGGTVSLLVPWPPKPGGDDLTRAVAAMRAAGQITVYESVTSDTSSGPREPMPLDLAADFFLSQEPYAAGTAPIVSRISGDGRPVRLALGYPTASINVALTLDAAGRITDETLTDTGHLVARRFVYPDPD